MEGILTSAQRERVGREVAIHAPITATTSYLIDATTRVVNRLESLAAGAAIWEMWKAGQVEFSWDESRQEIAMHTAESDDDEDGELIAYAVP